MGNYPRQPVVIDGPLSLRCWSQLAISLLLVVLYIAWRQKVSDALLHFLGYFHSNKNANKKCWKNVEKMLKNWCFVSWHTVFLNCQFPFIFLHNYFGLAVMNDASDVELKKSDSNVRFSVRKFALRVGARISYLKIYLLPIPPRYNLHSSCPPNFRILTLFRLNSVEEKNAQYTIICDAPGENRTANSAI